MENDILNKEAQSMGFANKHFTPGKRSMLGKLNPVKAIGKNRLRARSPEVYGKAMDLVDKSDDLLRELLVDQKNHLKQMEKFAKRLALVDFANYANKFLQEQKVMNAVVKNLSDPDIKYESKRIELNQYSDILL